MKASPEPFGTQPFAQANEASSVSLRHYDLQPLFDSSLNRFMSYKHIFLFAIMSWTIIFTSTDELVRYLFLVWTVDDAS